MTDERKKIINRIKKLLAMVNGGTIHEKEVAIYQAQRLMAKYHIEEYQIRDFAKDKIVEVMSNVSVRKVIWQILASSIASNFRCKLYHSSPNGKRTLIRPVFMGYQTDAEVAKEIFESAFRFAKKESTRVANYYYRTEGTSFGVKDEWLVGFINGLKDGFADQVELSNESALMVIIPPEVEDVYGKKTWANNALDPLGVNRNGNKALYDAGFNNGYAFSNNRKQSALEGD